MNRNNLHTTTELANAHIDLLSTTYLIAIITQNFAHLPFLHN